ncbi:crossover junction endodeoxyribonuclease RuvC [Bacteroidales bacterium OttesenSCG-928-B11]|nr:crossover junction endodeoxyribonuclease RuvC [Bacteroidales bacterium OttesenSCG-928-C03]MDL2312925.1 crossover junction endodeoxyribonuclease RuvC [Bacteroidales bacterium OttesenSCG-928-B11]MDL2325537.1 crossover junction endodeoxyribonuclease RuvC [Bacteroidales bacterium OttesenSCG-928-A14]
MVQGLILGVDPGTTVMGFALLQVKGGKTTVLEVNTVRMTRLPDQNAKLKRIFESTVEIVEKYKPEILAIEAPFFGKNPQSMLKLGRAQGVVIAACLYQGLEVFEYSPRKIKQSITGKGSASKEQVAAMLHRMCDIPSAPIALDATDALAAAYCHYLQNRIHTKDQNNSGWAGFLAKNSDRIIQ